MLESYSFGHVLAILELLAWPPGELLVCPPFGAFFRTTKMRGFGRFLCQIWSQLVFWVSWVFSIRHIFSSPSSFSFVPIPSFKNPLLEKK